jgi:hypothetical protein
MTARLAATVLLLEAFAVFFGTLVAAALLPPQGRWSTAQVWAAGGALAVVCLLVSGLVRRPAGIALGWLVQGLLVASGVFVPAMFAVGVVFAALWAWLVAIGRRIDADRRRWAAQAQR